MQVIPALDLLGDDAVRLEQGDYDRVLFRMPVEEFVHRLLATSPTFVHLVDLEGARDGRLRCDVVARCRSLIGDVGLQVSGGIRSIDAARDALAAGAARVIVGTALWSEPDALARYVNELGDRLVVGVDVRDDRLAVRGWRGTRPSAPSIRRGSWRTRWRCSATWWAIRCTRSSSRSCA